MMEIERKFLVGSDAYKSQAFHSFGIVQGYLNSDPARSVRIRIKEKKGFITIKGKSSDNGTSRFEWEKEIPLGEAKSLLCLCEPGIIEKKRYLIPVQVRGQTSELIFEVDEFSGNNKGLVIAEVELASADKFFDKPLWLGEEVTGKTNYYNAFLSKNPFKNW